MKRQSANVECLAMTLKPPWPRLDLPHVAIAGRSNVGKSSLLNQLFGKKKIAAVSKSPGKTKSLQFFLVANKFILCDLPGYGYAQVPKNLRRLWGSVIDSYVRGHPGPVGVLTLIDGRHLPTWQDIQLAEALAAAGKPRLLVLTKADKVGHGQRGQQAAAIAKALNCQASDLLWTSAKTGEGYDQVWLSLWDLFEFATLKQSPPADD